MLKPPAQYAVVTDFLKMYKAAGSTLLDGKVDIERLVNLRCSQLPFCPASLLLEYKFKGLIRPMDMRFAYYVGVGSAVHEVMQHYLSRQGQFLADYYCTQCGKFHRMSHKHTCCSFPTVYAEVLISFGGIVGHIDAIFKDAKGDYWILDFKTTSLKSSVSKKSNPGVVYEEQVESYAYLLFRQYGIRVKGVMLVFLPRDNPWTPVVWARELSKIHFSKIKDRLQKYRITHKAAMAATTVDEVYALAKNNRCKNPYCKYCKMDNTGLKDTIKRAFRITKNKLPMNDLRALIGDKPEGFITVSRAIPGPFISKRMPVPQLQELTKDDRLGVNRQVHKLIREINSLTDKLTEEA